jgi:hypothetical protein
LKVQTRRLITERVFRSFFSGYVRVINQIRRT